MDRRTSPGYLSALLMLTACSPDLGVCDEQALQLVQSPDGRTLYAGQALMHASCGGGAYCHSAGAEGDERFGVPAELDFDMNTPLATTGPGALDFRRGQLTTREWREDIWAEIEAGSMPPGDVGTVHVIPASRYTFSAAGAGGTQGESLPALDTDEGREIMRNWLACNAPVPEVDEWGGTETTADWTSIYASFTGSTCLSCHSRGAASGNLVLEAPDEGGDDACSAYLALIDRPAAGPAPPGGCGGEGILVDPDDPDGSLLLQKLENPDVCGDPMPPTGPLDAATVDAVRSWIAADAPAPAGCQ